MLSRIFKQRQTHVIHHYMKTLQGASPAQLALLGVPCHTQKVGTVFPSNTRLFSTSGKSSSSSSEDSDLDVGETRRPQSSFQGQRDARAFDPRAIIESIPRVIAEEVEQWSEEQVTKFISSVDRAIAFSNRETINASIENIKAMDAFLASRLEKENISAEQFDNTMIFISLCNGRGVRDTQTNSKY